MEQEEHRHSSKKGKTKKLSKAERIRLRQEEDAAAAAASAAAAAAVVSDPGALYGDYTLVDLQSALKPGLQWTSVCSLEQRHNGKLVLIRGRASIRKLGSKIVFVTVRERGYSVQCVLSTNSDVVSREMLEYANGISKESVVDIEGTVSVPPQPITGTTQQVEIQVKRIRCVDRAASVPPISVEDAARGEDEIENALKSGKQIARVNEDTRLEYRVLDMRTSPKQAIARLTSEVSYLFREFLRKEGFIEIHTPKILAGASEGGASVFKLDYKGQPASLAQSPQLHKQMAICADLGRVFEVGPAFRAEDSYTHRHLCEFIALVAEMEIRDHYFEVMDIVDRLFVEMFDNLNETCQELLEAIRKQFPFKSLKYLPKTLKLTFAEGIQMLQDAGCKVDPLGDLSTEYERMLGKLVLEKYGTEFYILYQFPLAVRPFFTMPCAENPGYSNSFDVFMRGEEIISGAQRLHRPELLVTRAKELGIDVNSISAYIDSFRYGVPPHGGFGAGLERVVMLFCALDNIRKVSLFPRDPQRLQP